MLFGYPVEAIADNWLHDCLFQMMQTIHSCLQLGQTLPSWPEIIPQSHRRQLTRRRGIKNRLIAYQTTAAALDAYELEQLVSALSEQNEVKRLLSGDCDCKMIGDLPEAIREPIKDLYDFAFRKLSDLGLRDCLYQIVYDRTPSHICPFCGCEYFDAPTAPREALDHYLAKSRYPFAAANLHNLVPMGAKCNSKYKATQDILYGDNGVRRKAYYPYGDVRIDVSLTNTQPFERLYGAFPFPDWQIDFDPDNEKTSTWDTVFHIRERYCRDVLDPEFISWLREFGRWYKTTNRSPLSAQDIVDALVGHLCRIWPLSEGEGMCRVASSDTIRFEIY